MGQTTSVKPARPRVGYIVKRYPRYSETFIVNELLAHEEAGLELEIFSLYPPNDERFQSTISRVRAPVSYVSAAGVKASDLWSTLAEASTLLPELWQRLGHGCDEEAQTVFQAATIARLARLRGITHLHAHFATQPASVARLAAHLAGVTYSFTAHAKDIFHDSVVPADLRRKLADAAAVVTVSDYNLAYLRARFPGAADRVVRIYNGLDLDEFTYHDPAPRRPRIVSVGRLVEKKGFEVLVDACAELARRGAAFDCDIIGAGPLADELRRRIAEHGLAERVRLLGPLPQSEVVAAVRGAAAFAGPYVIGEDGNRDGLPTVLIEAMALGTPVATTDVTGVPEVLEDGVTGLMVAQRDSAALAGALARLIADPALRRRLAATARARVEERFDVRRNTPVMRALFAAAESSGAVATLEKAS